MRRSSGSRACLLSSSLVAFTAVGGCGGETRAPIVGEEFVPVVVPERVPEPTADFEETECPFSVKGAVVQCGTVSVPGRDPDDTTFRIAVARVFSEGEDVANDPVVYLDGGPGGPSLPAVPSLAKAFEPLLEKRDLIFVDQRGVGFSEPSLACPDDGDDLLDAIAACHERVSRTVDPGAFTSAANAADFEAIRQAFRYPSWNLLGISYGTRLGLTIVRDRPEGVRSLLLDSVVPLQVDFLARIGKNSQDAFEVAFAACAADEECGRKYPNSMDQMREIAAGLAAKPYPFEDYELTDYDFLSILFTLLYTPSGVAIVPALIDLVATEKDFELLAEIGAESESGDDSFSFGMHLSLQCAEEVAFTSRELVEAADEEVFEELRVGFTGIDYLDYCENWPVPAAPALENQAVTTNVPTLVLSGSHDPITPPSYAELVHEDIPGSQYFEITNESHGASTGECGMTLASAFFDAPTEPVPAACLGTLGEIDFESTTTSRRGGRVGSAVEFRTDAPSPEDVRAIFEEARRRRSL